MKTSCPYCSQENAEEYRANQIYRTIADKSASFYKCKFCHTIYPKPRLLIQGIINKNQNNYSQDDFPNPKLPITLKETRCLINLIKKIQTNNHKIKNALDIGTSSGRFCFILESLGIEAIGIDIDENAVRSAKNYNLNVYLSDFPHEIPEDLKNQKYDLITLNEVIYYFTDLKKSFNEISNLLNEKGLLLIKTNHGDSYYYKEGNSFFSRHGDITQFMPTIESLYHQLNLSGFEVIKIIPYYPDNFYRITFGKDISDLPLISKLYNELIGRITFLGKRFINSSDRIIIVAEKKINFYPK